MAKLWSNNYSTTVTTATVGALDTFIDVTTVVGLPLIAAPDYVHLTLTDSLTAPTKTEIVRVTAISGNQLEVIREQESTTAQIWNSGDIIELRATADAFARLDGTEITRYVETANLSATTALDRADGGIQVLTLVGPATITLTIDNNESLTLHLLNGLTHGVTWPTISWINQTAPTLTNSDVFEFWKIDGVLYGAYVGFL